MFHSKFLDMSSLDLMVCNSNATTIIPTALHEDNSVLEFQIQAKPRTTSYNKLFFSLGQGLIELASTRFGSLGCYNSDISLTRHFSMALSTDMDSTIFEDNHQQTLPDLSKHQICQMIELWFSHHPLSIIVSKTLLPS